MEYKPFEKKIVIAKVKCFINKYDYQVSDVNIIKYQICKFSNTNKYINTEINYIKDNIIKNCKNLKLVKIYINIYDKNNIIHRFILSVSNIISDLLKIKENINVYKSIFIFIMYENKILFCGNLDFAHI